MRAAALISPLAGAQKKLVKGMGISALPQKTSKLRIPSMRLITECLFVVCAMVDCSFDKIKDP